MAITIDPTPEPLPPAKGSNATHEDVATWGIETRTALRSCNGDKEDIKQQFDELIDDENVRKRH